MLPTLVAFSRSLRRPFSSPYKHFEGLPLRLHALRSVDRSKTLQTHFLLPGLLTNWLLYPGPRAGTTLHQANQGQRACTTVIVTNYIPPRAYVGQTSSAGGAEPSPLRKSVPSFTSVDAKEFWTDTESKVNHLFCHARAFFLSTRNSLLAFVSASCRTKSLASLWKRPPTSQAPVLNRITGLYTKSG